MGLTASEKFVKMLSNSRAVSIAGATKTELGSSPRPPQGAYPEEGVYERIAQTVAEVGESGEVEAYRDAESPD